MLQMHRLELCWTDRKSKLSPNVRRKLRNTNFRLIVTEEVYKNYIEIIESQQEELHCTHAETNGYCSKIRNYVKLIIKVSMKWKNLKKFQSSTFDTIARRRSVEDEDAILELAGKIQDLQNETNCMNDSKRFSGS